MIARGLISLAVAAVVTLGLFLLMNSLIELGQVELDKNQGVRIADFIRQKKHSQIQTKKRELPRKKKVDSQPKSPTLDLPRSGGPGAQPVVQMSAPVPTLERKFRLAGGPSLGSAVSDAETVPLVRIQPMYPRRAAQKRIEGWVLLEFTISTKGAVKDARVIKAKPRNIFDRAALQAISKWKYKPKIVEGVAVETRGVQVKLTFKLEDL
jgi:protein TonB